MTDAIGLVPTRDGAERRRGPRVTTAPARTPAELEAARDAVMERLADQIAWYEREAARNNALYKVLRVASIGAAAAIPVLTAAQAPTVWAAFLGSTVVALEGVQGLFKFHANWVSFAATKEALKRERALFLAGADRYARTLEPLRVLAERSEALAARETDAWAELVRGVEHGDGKGDA